MLLSLILWIHDWHWRVRNAQHAVTLPHLRHHWSYHNQHLAFYHCLALRSSHLEGRHHRRIALIQRYLHHLLAIVSLVEAVASQHFASIFNVTYVKNPAFHLYLGRRYHRCQPFSSSMEVTWALKVEGKRNQPIPTWNDPCCYYSSLIVVDDLQFNQLYYAK